MSTCTAATSSIETTSTTQSLLLAFELGEEAWPLGFSPGFGAKVLRRKVPARDRAAVMREIARARAHFGLGEQARVYSCYEAGRDGFWLHRFLASLVEKGIGKDGSRWIRGVAIEPAWAWLRFQPESELSQWYQSRIGGGSKRLRKIGIVALARKLLIALWRYVEFGVLPEGAVRSQRLRLA